MAKTIDDMVVSAKEYADMTNYDYVEDATWFEWVNRGISDLWEALKSARGAEYFSKTAQFSTVAGQEDYTLAADVAYVTNVMITEGGHTRSMDKFEFADEPILRNRTGSSYEIQYHITGSTDFESDLSTIKLLPIPGGVYTVDYRYTPKPPVLTTGQSFGIINGWEEYAELHAAIKALTKRGSSTSALEKQLARVSGKISMMKSSRDAHRPPRIKDTNRDYAGSPRWRRYGDVQ